MTLSVEKLKGPFWIPKRMDVFGEESHRVSWLTNNRITFNGRYGATKGGIVFHSRRDEIKPGETKEITYHGAKFSVRGY